MGAPSPYRQRRIATEIYEHSLDGAVFYGICCLLIMAASRLPLGRHALLGALALGYLLLWAARRLNCVPADDGELPAWQRRHFLLIHVGSLMWSLAVCRTLWVDGAQSMALMVAVLCTAAFAVALANLYAAVRPQAILATALLIGPFLLAAIYQPQARPLALPLVVLMLYVFVGTRRAQMRVDAQLDMEEALHASRAEVERLTLQDGLTLLANRRAFDAHAPKAWDQAQRRQAPLSLIMADIDHFKRINDTHGHAAGDSCLRHFAALMQAQFRRAGDLPVRFGGEEFVVLLADCPLADAVGLADSFRALLAASPTLHENLSIALSASFGVAQAHWDGEDNIAQMLERADAALYRAKRGGRNRVEAEASA